MNNIFLEWVNTNELHNEVMRLSQDELILSVMHYFRSRYISSACTFLIKKDDESIGFINLVNEHGLDNVLGIDMGVICGYRGKGYGHKALQILKDIVIENAGLNESIIIGETEKTNIPANKSMIGLGVNVYNDERCNYYLFWPPAADGEIARQLEMKHNKRKQNL